jgi:hypothetical protein
VLLPKKKFDEYVALYGEIFHERVHYIDPVHEMKSRDEVLKMLAKYVPRAANDKFRFELITDSDSVVIWRWTIALKIRFTPFEFAINGLVHANVEDGKIVYQREYYDPMESIGVIPLFGRLYKLILKMG